MQDNTKVILLNGPMSIGKTEGLKYCKSKVGSLHPYLHRLMDGQCKRHLHTLTMNFFNVPEKDYWVLYNDGVGKNLPCSLFDIYMHTQEAYGLKVIAGAGELERLGNTKYRLSLRQAMIYVSELMVKPRLGYDYFGKARARYIEDNKQSSNDAIYLDDSASAFNVDGVLKCDEIPPLYNVVSRENVLLIRLHREGYDFSGDSREYIPDGVVDNTIDLCNNASEIEFYEKLSKTIKQFLDKV